VRGLSFDVVADSESETAITWGAVEMLVRDVTKEKRSSQDKPETHIRVLKGFGPNTAESGNRGGRSLRGDLRPAGELEQG
jgi:hypothetical protein